MRCVITTDFSTLCCANKRPERRAWPRLCGLILVTGWLWAGWGGAARAEGIDIQSLRLERTEDGVFLSAVVQFLLPAVVEDTLLKGIPVTFVAEADLLRDRWYWYDKKVLSANRQMRLSYQPLTRRWRVQYASGTFPVSNQGVSLGQGYDQLDDALLAIQRISRWKIAEPQDVEPDARHNVEFRYRLDMGQLPRLFQIGALGQADWALSVSRNQRLLVEVPK